MTPFGPNDKGRKTIRGLSVQTCLNVHAHDLFYRARAHLNHPSWLKLASVFLHTARTCTLLFCAYRIILFCSPTPTIRRLKPTAHRQKAPMRPAARRARACSLRLDWIGSKKSAPAWVHLCVNVIDLQATCLASDAPAQRARTARNAGESQPSKWKENLWHSTRIRKTVSGLSSTE